jgi:hypothetical protein
VPKAPKEIQQVRFIADQAVNYRLPRSPHPGLSFQFISLGLNSQARQQANTRSPQGSGDKSLVADGGETGTELAVERASSRRAPRHA